jgi:GGDEF domain-containing protein
MVDVDEFRTIRKNYGDPAARKVLRTLADHLSERFGNQRVFRDWTDRFFILPDSRLRGESSVSEVADWLKRFNRVTFRSNDGRGFYATLTSAHLSVPQGISDAQSVLDKLTRILNRAKKTQRGDMMSAAMDPESTGGLFLDASEADSKRPRWEPVVLTRKDD